MDSPLNLLKEEINESNGAVQDLAKWKLIVTAALGAAAFGVLQNDRKYWLLLFLPFVCAYIDLYTYQLRLRVRVISKFLQVHGEGEGLLKRYEKWCETMRGLGKHVFSLDTWAGVGCSVGICLSGPIIYYLRPEAASHDYLKIRVAWAAGIWFLGVFLILSLFVISCVIEARIPPPTDSGHQRS